MALQRERENADKERKKDKKKKNKRKEKLREELGNDRKRKRQLNEVCLPHPSCEDDPKSKSGKHRNKRQCIDNTILHVSKKVTNKAKIGKEHDSGAITEEQKEALVPLTNQNNAVQYAVTRKSFGGALSVLGGALQKSKEHAGYHPKRKRDNAFQHPGRGNDPNSRLEECHKKRHCGEITMLHESGNTPKKRCIEKEQSNAIAMTEECEGATLYTNNPADLQDAAYRKKQTDVTKKPVGGGLRIRVPFPKLHVTAVAPLSSGQAEASSKICASHTVVQQTTAKVGTSHVSQHEFHSVVNKQHESFHDVAKQTGHTHQTCNTHNVVRRRRSPCVNGVRSVPKETEAAPVRPLQSAASVIKQHDPCNSLGEKIESLYQICGGYTTPKPNGAPVIGTVCAAKRQLGAAPISRPVKVPAATIKLHGAASVSRPPEVPATAIEQHKDGDVVFEQAKPSSGNSGSDRLVSEREKKTSVSAANMQDRAGPVPAHGKAPASAIKQHGAASISRPFEIPVTAIEHHGQSDGSAEQGKPSHGNSGTGRKHKVPMKSVSTDNGQDRASSLASQGKLPALIKRRDRHHLVVGEQAGALPQIKRDDAMNEKCRAVNVRVSEEKSEENREAGANPVSRHNEPPASVKRQAPIIKHNGFHDAVGEHARTSPCTFGNAVVAEKDKTSNKTGVVEVRDDEFPFLINKQPQPSKSIENRRNISSFSKNNHCGSVVEQSKGHLHPSTLPAANMKKPEPGVSTVSKQEREDPTSLQCRGVQSLSDKKPESAGSNIVQPVTPDIIDQPFISGRKEDSHKQKVASTTVKGADTQTAFQGSRRSQRQEAKYRDLVLNWKPEPLQTEFLPGDDGLDWLTSNAKQPTRQTVTGCHFENEDGVQFKVISPSWPPRACPLPELNLYALPFVVPL